MDETEQSKQTTPLGNERRDNPGQTNIMMNSDGADLTPAVPQWDENTPLEDIAKQYTDIGGKFNDLVENAADNIGDRQIQLVGNDFGATNPYMFNTYYEPAATSFASKMRVEGTNEALNEGLDRAEKEAQKNLAAAKQRYNNAVAAQKAREAAEQARRNANAYASETDMSKMPQGTNERDLMNSLEFQNMSDDDKKKALTDARIHDLQDTLKSAGDNIDWNIKDDRAWATDNTLSEFGKTRDELKAMSKEERDAFWARKDVGNYWTEQYMLRYYEQHYSPERAAAMQESFNDIKSDINNIIDAINNNSVDELDFSNFITAVPISTGYKFGDVEASINKSDLSDEEKSEIINTFKSTGLSDSDAEAAFNALLSGAVKLNAEEYKITIKDDSALTDSLKSKIESFNKQNRTDNQGLYNNLDGDKKDIYEQFSQIGHVAAIFDKGKDLPRIVGNPLTKYDKGSVTLYSTGYQYTTASSLNGGTAPVSIHEQDELKSIYADNLFRATFGVDWQTLEAMADLKVNSPDDYEYLMNQATFLMSNNPVEIVEDENKEYFINGEYKKLSKGDLVFHTIDGTVGKDGKFTDQDLQHYIDLYKRIYNGQEEASEDNLNRLQSYYSAYASRLQAAMAATGRYGVQVDEDIYGAILLVMGSDNDNDKLVFNPNDPTGDKISLNEFKTWWNNLKEDEQYNFYTAVADRARSTTGHYYIYDDDLGIVKDVLGGKSNGENIIGKRGKSEGDKNMWAADKVKNFSDEQCLAINMLLDFQMRNGGVESKFFDNEEVSLHTRAVNSFFNAAVGSVQFVGWAGSSALGWMAERLSGDQNNLFYKFAGDVWDDMTEITPEDNISFLDDKDLVLGNSWTMEVRTQQRANLNHLIDTTFNVDFFDPDNTYDEATGEIKDKDGNVVAYTDNHFFHNDDWKAGLDFTVNLGAGIAEFVVETIVTAGVGGLIKKGASKVVSKSPLAQRMVRLLTANCSVTGVRSARKINQEMKALAKAQKAAQKAGKKIVAQQSKFGKTVLRVMDQDALAKQAGSFAGAAAGASSVADDTARVAGREIVTHLDDAGRAVNTGSSVVDDAIKGEASLLDDATKGGSSLVDDVTRNNPLGQVSDNVVEGAYEGEMKMSAAGVEWSASGAQEMAARNYALDTLIESADSSTVTAAEKLATFFEKALTKVGKTVNKISPFKGLAQDLHSMLRESSLNMLQRAAMNTRVAEAAGVSVSQISKLSDNAVSVLYNALRISEGKGATNLGAYTNRFLPQAGSSVAKGNIDFAKAVKEAVSQSTALASAGKGLTAEDTIRILARNSLDKNALLSSLKSSKFIKDRVVDWAQDIKMNYYTPYLDNEFNSDYTDVQEYFSDPTQWLSGAVFDLGVSGIRRIGSSTSLALTNQKINKLIGKIDISPGSVVDQAKLNKNLAKLNSARMKADRLTNQILDGNISVNKVSETRERATRVLDEYMNRITDGFDYEKGMQQLASNMEIAMAESNAWDKVQDFFTTKNGTALLGRSRAMQAMDLNRYLLKSNDSLNAFYMLAQAEQSSAVINFADAKAHSENLRRVTGEQWAQIVADGFFKSGLKKTSALFDLKGNTINVSDKAQAKALLAEGQKVLYDAIYDSAKEKLGDKVGVAIDWPAFRSELNWVRDQMVEMGSKQIDLGNSVRWNYFPTQGIMFEMDPETPIALAGFYYGSGLHPDVSNQMANPFDTRDTWDMASISENVQSGVYSYKQPIGMKEQIRNEAHGITATQKEIPYNMDFFNPVYALTAYRNAFNSKQFAAKMFDPMSNGHVVVKSDSALQYATDSTNTRLSSSADVLEAKLKKEYTDAHQPKTYRSTKKLAQDIDTLRSKTQTGITDVQKNIRNVSSRDINAQTRKLNKELAKGEEAVVKSDLFKGYRDYAGLKGKSSKTVAKSMMDSYDQAVADVKAVRKALKAGQETPEGVSDAYKSSTLYRQNIDALARDKNLTRDVISNNQSIRIGGENGVDLNVNALKTPFYNTIASLEQTKRINKSWDNFLKALSEDSALVTGTKYSLQDFIEIHSLDETDLRKNMSAKIFDIVNDKYGTFNEVAGGKTLNKTFSKTLNQAIYDAIDDVSLRKAAGEGISMVEVIEELNNKFPGMEIAGDEKYWNLLTDLSKYSNGGGDITTLKASISAELQYRANKGELNSKETQKLIKMLGVIDEASDQSSRLSGLANNSAAIMDIDEALDAGDERMLIDEGANPETQAIEREKAAENTPDEKVSDVINKTYDVSALSDKERLKALTEGLEVLRKNASGASDVATRIEFNSNVFKTFRTEIKEPYNDIAGEIEKKLKKKGVEINDNIKSILYPPEKGIFEGVSDAQMLRYRRDLERGQDIRVGKTYYKGDGKTVRQGLEIGQDGRGIVNYYKPKALQKLVEKYDIKLTKKNAAALDKLTNGSTEFSLGGKKHTIGYAEFAEAMTGNEYRYAPKDNVVNLRTAVENDISSHKTNATRLLRTSEEGLGTTAPKEGKFWNNGPTIKMLDADNKAISISLITDTGSFGAFEAAQQFDKTTSDAIGYHLEVTKADGSVESFADFDDLANSEIFKKKNGEAPYISASELEDSFRESGYTIPEASYGDVKTNHFGKMDADEIEERRINEYIDRKRSENTARKTTSKGTTVLTGKSDAKKKPSAADIRTQRELNEWNIAQQKRFNEYDNVATERTAPEDFLRTSRVKIISGGQTGVDTIGLEVGKELGLETGGTAAPGFYREFNKDKYTSEDMAAFGLKEIDADTQAKGLEASGQFYNPRTEQNVINSDGTVYFSSNTNSAGYASTKRYADANEKPFILNPTASQLREWMAANNVKTLNVAGSRGSHIDDNFSKRVKGILTTALKDSADTSAQTGTPDIRNPKNWSIESIMFTNRATDKARKAYFDDYNRYQRLKEISKDYTNNSSALDFAEETSNYNMTISEQKLNTFLYGDAEGHTGHFDKVNEINERIKRLGSNTEKLFNEKISDRISALKKLDGTSYNEIVETLEAAKAEAMDAYKENPAVQKVIGKRFDEEIDFMKKKLGKTKRDAQAFADHDSTLKALREAQNGHKNLSAGEGQVIVHNASGVMIVGNGATLQNRISLKDLREANDVVDVSNEKTLNPIKSISNAKKGKSVLKDMRKSFNDGYEIKGKISSNTARQRDSWIDSIVKEARERTGNPDLDEADIYVDKQMANLGQFYFREGRQGWQEKAYKAMSSISDFNKQIQDFHLAGGVGQFNAFTLRNAITMMWQDPVGGTRALFSNFKNAKDNTSVMRFFLDNHEKLLKYAVDSGDFSIINAFAPIVSMDERLTGGGVINGVLNQIYGAKNTFKDALEREGKRSAVLSVPKGIYEEIFSNPTFARWTVIAKADMQMRNYAKAKKFVDGLAIRYKLSDEDFAKADDGMWGSKDQFIANLARLRTDRYWNPADFAKSGFSTKKYLKRREKGDMKTTAESLKGVPADKSLAECASDFFFAINYKLQMNAHPINGIGSMISSVFTVPRASVMARNGNLAPMAMRFAGRGDRTQAAVMIGIAALAHAWNTHIGAPSAWEELWGDHGNKDNGTYGIAQSLLNFQDFGKFWIPNDGKGGFDPNKTAYSVDPFFSIFTLQNTGARALNKALYPNQVPINWQRTVSTEPTSVATRIGGVADELIGANLLSGYKAIYEVCMNSTYFGNNIWERKYLPDGTVNKNYNPLRNVIASMAHILNLDAVLEGKSPTENGSNRWVKGLTVESGKGLIIGDPGVRQDKTGTVSGSGIFQHEYTSALGAVANGEYFDGLTEAMELPFKSRNYAARAKTALNQEVMLAMRNELHKYEKAIKNATPEQKDKAYAEFANATVNIMHDWSAKYGDVLGKNDELTSTATKIMVAFLSDEYDDRTAYVQNVYEHLRQELKMADGDQFLYSKDRLEEAIASGMNPEEAAATYNKHLTALKEAQIAEYNARKALLDAGINIDPDKNIFDTNDFLYADFEAEKATVNKKLLTEIRGKLDSKIGEFSNYKEMKAYYESLIDDATTTKQKAKIAKEYNKFVEDIISPYLEEYGENILNSSYWDGDYLSNHLGKYLIIPADTQYRGKTPYSNFLKDEFGVGFRDSKNLPSDDEIKEAIAKANKALAQGRTASTKAIVDNALVQSRRGAVHASKEDYEKLLRLRAMLSSRSN